MATGSTMQHNKQWQHVSAAVVQNIIDFWKLQTDVDAVAMSKLDADLVNEAPVKLTKNHLEKSKTVLSLQSKSIDLLLLQKHTAIFLHRNTSEIVGCDRDKT